MHQGIFLLLLKARNKSVFRMNSFLYRNKRQASYHTPLAIRPTNKQNSKTASIKNKTRKPEDDLSQSFKNNKTCSEEKPRQITCLEIDSIFPWECSFQWRSAIFSGCLEIPQFNIYPLTFSQIGANSLSCHQHLNNMSNQSTYGSKVSLLNIRHMSSVNKWSLFFIEDKIGVIINFSGAYIFHFAAEFLWT